MAIQRRTQLSIWYFIGAFLLLLALNVRFFSGPVQEKPYSEFRRLVRAGAVEEVILTTPKISGTLRDPARTGEPTRFWTVRVEDPDLLANLRAHGVRFSARVESTWFMEAIAWIASMALFFVIWMFLIRRMSGGGGAGGVMSIGKSKAKIYVETDTKVTFADVAGIDEALEEVREVVEFLKEPDRFKRLGGRIPKGVLLVGPPGTGKTLLARAVAGESGVPFFSLSGSDFVEMFVGVGAARVRDLFQQAKERAPCIVFIDELDALGKARGVNPMGSHDEREQTLNQLLSEMDGFDAQTNVIIMAATNRPEILDMALLRPGRFDRQIVVDRPDINGREAILKVHVKKITLDEDVNLRTISARTPGMVGADLANMVNEAALLAARKGRDAVAQSDFEAAIDRVVGGLERKSRVLSDTERRIAAYHEVGHALVSECLEHTDPVHRISIIPRGVASLGQTMYLPTGDRYLMSKEELEDRLATVLGGRVAEEVMFNETSTGAGSDFRRASQIAQRMVKDYGMSDLGLVAYGEPTTFLQGQMPGGNGIYYSEETAGAIDREVRKIISQAYERVREIVLAHQDAIRTLAENLMEKEDIAGDEFRRMLVEAGVRVARPAKRANGDATTEDLEIGAHGEGTNGTAAPSTDGESG